MTVEQESPAQDSLEDKIAVAVDAYVELVASGTGEQIADLFAADGTVELVKSVDGGASAAGAGAGAAAGAGASGAAAGAAGASGAGAGAAGAASAGP